MMHAAVQFFGFWGLAFVTLSAAVVLLNIYDNVIGNDLVLHSLGKEVAIAGFASLVEGAGVWAIVRFVPAASRALVVPAIIVALIYKIAHLEDWGKFDVMMLLVFQMAVGLFASMVIGGHFATALLVLVLFGGLLAVIAAVVRGL